MRDIILKRLNFLERDKNSNSNLWNITWEQGLFLEGLVEIKKPKNILEIGTSNGFSALWIASGVYDCDFEFDTIDIDSKRLDMASRNFRLCKLDDKIKCHLGDAFEILSDLEGKKYDFIFIDAIHKKYRELVEKLVEMDLLEKDFTMVFDNVTSHNMDEFASYMCENYECERVEIGGGMLVVKDKI
jgi:predicted O-methyltransferase YrrM